MSNFPKLRFIDKDDKFECRKFSDLFSFHTTNSLSRDNLNYETGSVFNIHYGDIHTKFATMFDAASEDIPYINADISLKKIKKENYCKIGDLVIADASENYEDIGKSIEIINLGDTPTLAGLHTHLARPKGNALHIGFSGYLMRAPHVRQQIKKEAQGTKVLGLSTGRLSTITLQFPKDCREQQKIADFLSSIDTKISQLMEKHRLLKEYKKGVMQQIFNQKIRFKDKDGQAFPDWESKPLSKVLEEHKKKSIIENEFEVLTSSRNGLLKQTDYYGDGRLTERSNIGFHVIPTGYVTYRSRSDDRKFFFNINDLGETGVISHYYPVFRMKNGQNKFFVELTRHHSHVFGKYAVGTSQVVLSFKALCEIKFPFPCLEEQQKIAEFLQLLDSKINAVAEQIEQTKQFKKGLLQQMFV